MSKFNTLKLLCALTVVACGAVALTLRADDQAATDAQPTAGKEGDKGRFYEMRTYHANEGKLEALHQRFRDHTNKLFAKHGIEMIGYWTPADEPASKNTLVFILAYPSREAREESWQAFTSDPEWQKAKAESEKDGPLVGKVDQVFMNPTDYSPIK